MNFRRVMGIVWPAFMVACVLEALVFAMIDPRDIRWFGESVQVSREGFYTLTFLVFWVTVMVSSALTTLLAMSSREVNGAP
ncbi:MAG: hypothetical protein WAV85_04340 [Rhodoferax sp.]